MKILVVLALCVYALGLPVNEQSETPEELLQRVLAANPQENDISLKGSNPIQTSDILEENQTEDEPSVSTTQVPLEEYESKTDESSTLPKSSQTVDGDVLMPKIEPSEDETLVESTTTDGNSQNEKIVIAEVGDVSFDPLINGTEMNKQAEAILQTIMQAIEEQNETIQHYPKTKGHEEENGSPDVDPPKYTENPEKLNSTIVGNELSGNDTQNIIDEDSDLNLRPVIPQDITPNFEVQEPVIDITYDGVIKSPEDLALTNSNEQSDDIIPFVVENPFLSPFDTLPNEPLDRVLPFDEDEDGPLLVIVPATDSEYNEMNEPLLTDENVKDMENVQENAPYEDIRSKLLGTELIDDNLENMPVLEEDSLIIEPYDTLLSPDDVTGSKLLGTELMDDNLENMPVLEEDSLTVEPYDTPLSPDDVTGSKLLGTELMDDNLENMPVLEEDSLTVEPYDTLLSPDDVIDNEPLDQSIPSDGYEEKPILIIDRIMDTQEIANDDPSITNEKFEDIQNDEENIPHDVQTNNKPLDTDLVDENLENMPENVNVEPYDTLLTPSDPVQNEPIDYGVLSDGDEESDLIVIVPTTDAQENVMNDSILADENTEDLQNVQENAPNDENTGSKLIEDNPEHIPVLEEDSVIIEPYDTPLTPVDIIQNEPLDQSLLFDEDEEGPLLVIDPTTNSQNPVINEPTLTDEITEDIQNDPSMSTDLMDESLDNTPALEDEGVIIEPYDPVLPEDEGVIIEPYDPVLPEDEGVIIELYNPVLPDQEPEINLYETSLMEDIPENTQNGNVLLFENPQSPIYESVPESQKILTEAYENGDGIIEETNINPETLPQEHSTDNMSENMQNQYFVSEIEGNVPLSLDFDTRNRYDESNPEYFDVSNIPEMPEEIVFDRVVGEDGLPDYTPDELIPRAEIQDVFRENGDYTPSEQEGHFTYVKNEPYEIPMESVNDNFDPTLQIQDSEIFENQGDVPHGPALDTNSNPDFNEHQENVHYGAAKDMTVQENINYNQPPSMDDNHGNVEYDIPPAMIEHQEYFNYDPTTNQQNRPFVPYDTGFEMIRSEPRNPNEAFYSPDINMHDETHGTNYNPYKQNGVFTNPFLNRFFLKDDNGYEHFYHPVKESTPITHIFNPSEDAFNPPEINIYANDSDGQRDVPQENPHDSDRLIPQDNPVEQKENEQIEQVTQDDQDMTQTVTDSVLPGTTDEPPSQKVSKRVDETDFTMTKNSPYSDAFQDTSDGVQFLSYDEIMNHYNSFPLHQSAPGVFYPRIPPKTDYNSVIIFLDNPDEEQIKEGTVMDTNNDDELITTTLQPEGPTSMQNDTADNIIVQEKYPMNDMTNPSHQTQDSSFKPNLEIPYPSSNPVFQPDYKTPRRPYTWYPINDQRPSRLRYRFPEPSIDYDYVVLNPYHHSSDFSPMPYSQPYKRKYLVDLFTKGNRPERNRFTNYNSFNKRQNYQRQPEPVFEQFYY